MRFARLLFGTEVHHEVDPRARQLDRENDGVRPDGGRQERGGRAARETRRWARQSKSRARGGLARCNQKRLDIIEPPREVLKKEVFKTEALRSALQDAPPRNAQTARPIAPSELQNEIRSRIESFRAHQERFNRERAEYFNATLARLRASLDEARASRFDK